MRQDDSSEFVGRPIPSAAPKPVVLEKKPVVGIDVRQIFNPQRRNRCVFRYVDANDDVSVLIGGSLFKSQTPGYGVTIGIDAGRFGVPSIGLSIRVNKGNKKVPVSKNPDEYFQYDIKYRAGIQIDGSSVIEALEIDRPSDHDVNDATYDTEVMDNFPKDQARAREETMFILFTAKSAKISPFEEVWLEGLDSDVREGLTSLFTNVGHHMVMIWMVTHPDLRTAYDEWARFLVDAVASGRPAMWQYLLDDMKTPNWRIDTNPHIKNIANGMYVQ